MRLYGGNGSSTVQEHKPCSISLVPRYPVYTLLVTEYLVLKIGFLWIMVQKTLNISGYLIAFQ